MSTRTIHVIDAGEIRGPHAGENRVVHVFRQVHAAAGGNPDDVAAISELTGYDMRTVEKASSWLIAAGFIGD